MGLTTLEELYKIASGDNTGNKAVAGAELAGGAAGLGLGAYAGKKAYDKIKTVKETGRAIDENKKTIDAFLDRAQNHKALHGELSQRISDLEMSNKGILNKIKQMFSRNKVNNKIKDLTNTKKELLSDIIQSYTAADSVRRSNEELAQFAKKNKKAGILYGLGALAAGGLGAYGVADGIKGIKKEASYEEAGLLFKIAAKKRKKGILLRKSDMVDENRANRVSQVIRSQQKQQQPKVEATPENRGATVKDTYKEYDLMARHQGATNHIAQLKSNMAALEHEKNIMERLYDKALKGNAEYQQQIREQYGTIQNFKSRINDLTQQIGQHKRTIDDLTQQIGQHKSTINDYKQKVQDLNSHLNDINARYTQTQQDLTNLTGEHNKLKTNYGELEKSLGRWKKGAGALGALALVGLGTSGYQAYKDHQ